AVLHHAEVAMFLAILLPYILAQVHVRNYRDFSPPTQEGRYTPDTLSATVSLMHKDLRCQMASIFSKNAAKCEGWANFFLSFLCVLCGELYRFQVQTAPRPPIPL